MDVKKVITAFYERVATDPMIGFYFRQSNISRLIELECQLVETLLDGKERYVGRPLAEVHAPFQIPGGHFDRRLTLLRETLAEHRVPFAVQEKWIQHAQSLKALVVRRGCP